MNTRAQAISANLLISIGETLIPAKAFQDRVLETRFLRDFRSSGVSTIFWFSLVGSIWTAVMLLFEVFVNPSAREMSLGEMVHRVALTLVLAALSGALLRFPKIARDNYRLCVLVPVAFSLIALSAVPLVVPMDFEFKVMRIVSATLMICVAAFALIRARICEIAPVALASASILAFGFFIQGGAGFFVVLLYAIAANAIGWILCVYVEQRERRLFRQTIELERLSSALALKANEAERISIERSKLLQVVAHDLRQPVASLQLQLAKMRVSGKYDNNPNDPVPQASACVEILREGVDRLLESEELSERPLPVGLVNPRDFIVRAGAAFGFDDEATGISIKVRQYRAELPTVKSNVEHVWNVLSNLTSNAIKFRRANAESTHVVLISFTVLRRFVRVDVRDNGQGIAREFIPLVFEPFWRGTATVDGSDITGTGQGLGLSIVRNLIEHLPGHSIRLESQIGMGTRVRVYLPRVEGS